MMRTFSLIFAGKRKEMTVRSSEVLWAMILPIMILTGVSLHLYFILQQFNLLPSWESLDQKLALFLITSTSLGLSLSAILYIPQRKKKPVEFVPNSLQQLLAPPGYCWCSFIHLVWR